MISGTLLFDIAELEFGGILLLFGIAALGSTWTLLFGIAELALIGIELFGIAELTLDGIELFGIAALTNTWLFDIARLSLPIGTLLFGIAELFTGIWLFGIAEFPIDTLLFGIAVFASVEAVLFGIAESVSLTNTLAK